jgi:hypothetical protein
MKKLLILLSFFIVPNTILAQMPETVVYLFDMQNTKKGITLSNARIISNKKGYNNQPSFTPDLENILYVSSVNEKNTEIYKYNIKRKKSKRLTHTPEPEYSPQITPEGDAISCVRVEKDTVTQHFYFYSLKGKKPKLQLPKLDRIGYYSWLNANEISVFTVPEPFGFYKYNLSTQIGDSIGYGIGRCMKYERGKLMYVDKRDSAKWYIRIVSKENMKPKMKTASPENTILSETLEGEEDYCLLLDGSLLMGHNGFLYKKDIPHRKPENKWYVVEDLKKFGIDTFYRIVVSQNNQMLAVVAFKGKKP